MVLVAFVEVGPMVFEAVEEIEAQLVLYVKFSLRLAMMQSFVIIVILLNLFLPISGEIQLHTSSIYLFTQMTSPLLHLSLISTISGLLHLLLPTRVHHLQVFLIDHLHNSTFHSHKNLLKHILLELSIVPLLLPPYNSTLTMELHIM